MTHSFEPEPATTRRETTNVVFCLVHQRNWFRKFWALLESTRQMGFASRFCFSFGRRPRRQRRMDAAGFATAVMEPMMQYFFEMYIEHLGPKASFVGEGERLKVWPMDAAASALLAHCNRIHRLLMLHTKNSAAFNTPLSKCDYWLPNMALEFEILGQFVSHLRQPTRTHPLQLVPLVTFPSFHLAMSYFAKRYMGGHAVLQRDIRRQSWNNDDAEEDREDRAATSTMELGEAVKILREVPFFCISTRDVAAHMLEYELAHSNTSSRQARTMAAVEAAFHLLESHGLGRAIRNPDFDMLWFQKRFFGAMSRDTQELMLTEHVTTSSFGSEWCVASDILRPPTTSRFSTHRPLSLANTPACPAPTYNRGAPSDHITREHHWVVSSQ